MRRAERLEPPWLASFRRLARIDLAPSHDQPSGISLAIATVASLVVSLALDTLIAHGAVHVFPSTRHFSHFHPGDYATLTVIGVLVACAAWPAVTRVSSAPRWLFSRCAVAVTIVLFLPDALLYARGDNPKGVLALAVMHVAIALATYNILVHVARVRRDSSARPARAVALAPLELSERLVRRIWAGVGMLLAADFALGVVTIVSVPFHRPDALVPPKGVWIYSAHGAVGIALGVAAVGVLVLSVVTERMARIGAWIGASGVVAGLVGGVLASFQSARLLGMAIMLVGVLVAAIGYMVPTLDAMGTRDAEAAQAARARLTRARVNGEVTSMSLGDGLSTNGHGEHRDPTPPAS